MVPKEQLEVEYRKVARRGKLKIAEFKAFLTTIGFAKAQDVAQRLFNAFDLNRDGELEAEEFISGLTLMMDEDRDRKLQRREEASEGREEALESERAELAGLLSEPWSSVRQMPLLNAWLPWTTCVPLVGSA